MVHSIELLFDRDTEAAIQRMWDALADLNSARMPIRIPPGRPHVTVAVAKHITAEVDELLAPVRARLPLPCLVGAPVLFGRGKLDLVFALLVVPSRELLTLHADVYRVCSAVAEPMANTLPGQWTPHVTLARRMRSADLGRAVDIAGRPIPGVFTAMRHWDGDRRVEHPIE